MLEVVVQHLGETLTDCLDTITYDCLKFTSAFFYSALSRRNELHEADRDVLGPVLRHFIEKRMDVSVIVIPSFKIKLPEYDDEDGAPDVFVMQNDYYELLGTPVPSNQEVLQSALALAKFRPDIVLDEPVFIERDLLLVGGSSGSVLHVTRRKNPCSRPTAFVDKGPVYYSHYLNTLKEEPQPVFIVNKDITFGLQNVTLLSGIKAMHGFVHIHACSLSTIVVDNKASVVVDSSIIDAFPKGKCPSKISHIQNAIQYNDGTSAPPPPKNQRAAFAGILLFTQSYYKTRQRLYKLSPMPKPNLSNQL